MNIFYKIFLLIFANLVILSTAESATFYVNGATGNNSNTPTLAKNIDTPWLTVQYAIDNPAVVNGDNIVVAEGLYAGFVLTKRLNIIGAWKGGMVSVSTIFNSTVTLSAAGGSVSERMMLKNLRILSTAGDAIDSRGSYITLENVFASTSAVGFNGMRFNGFVNNDILIEASNFNNNNRAGLFFPSFANVDGFVMKNTTVNNNGYFGIVAFQTPSNPSEIKNVEISHCTFIDNNPTNQVQGHTIYFEKLKNAVFQNISVVMPPTNVRIGIDINLLSREDYTNISIINSRVTRSTPGSGIWIQARNDLNYPAARLDTVLLRGLTFNNCDTNIAFNRQVKNMTVDKCDLSTYLTYGLVNYTDQGGTIEAANNKWQNGATPDTTVISGGLLVTGSNIISFMPSTDGIFIGMGIQGPGVKPGATVIGKSPNTVIMSDTAISDGFSPQIGFAFNFATSTDIVRTSLNFTHTGNPLPHSIVNQNNVSFPDLTSAINGTAHGGSLWNVPSGTIPGTTVMTNELSLFTPGAGFLHSGSMTTFENLTVPSFMYMGSDYAVSGHLEMGIISIGQNNTIVINGSISASGHFFGGSSSDMFIGGAGPGIEMRDVVGGLRTLQLTRPNGASLSTFMEIRRLLFLQNGNLSLGNHNLLLLENCTIFNPNPTSSYINTNGTGSVKKIFLSNTPTAFNYTVGAGSYSPVRVYFSNLVSALTAHLDVKVVNAKHPQNQCVTDYLNRYWTIAETGLAGSTSNLLFSYDAADAVGTEANIYGAEWDGFGWTTFTPVNAVNHTFTTNGITSYGDFSGGGLNCIGNFLTIANTVAILEGAYISGVSIDMRTVMQEKGLIPLSQPYAGSQFNYNGTESVASIPAGVVDWIYLELRATSDGGAIPSGRRAAFMKSNGSIVDLDGVSPVKLDVVSGDYYIVLGHRNHLPVMSKTAQTLNTNSALYNFTTGLDKYFGDQAADLGDGRFGLYSGDANKTFAVTAADYTVVTDNLLQVNYNQGDLNLTGAVTAADYSFVTRNLLKVSNVPGYPPF